MFQADVGIASRKGRTAYDMAFAHGHIVVANLLKGAIRGQSNEHKNESSRLTSPATCDVGDSTLVPNVGECSNIENQRDSADGWKRGVADVLARKAADEEAHKLILEEKSKQSHC